MLYVPKVGQNTEKTECEKTSSSVSLEQFNEERKQIYRGKEDHLRCY